MTIVTAPSTALRGVLAARRSAVDEVLARYHARNPRLIGSVARGDATLDSDIDLLVDLDPGHGNPLMRVAGMGEELGLVLGVRVDVVAEPLLRHGVAATALRDAVAL